MMRDDAEVRALRDDDICLCDAYRPDKRPGKCPIHGRKSP